MKRYDIFYRNKKTFEISTDSTRKKNYHIEQISAFSESSQQITTA